MQNIKCLVEECIYNAANYCSAKSITVGTSATNKCACASCDTACEMFTPRY